MMRLSPFGVNMTRLPLSPPVIAEEIEAARKRV